jgi:hypothetical protein
VIVPNKQYAVSVKFNETENRWKAKFESVKFPGISYDFPLPDGGPYDINHAIVVGRPTLGNQEEMLLALVFSQMVSMTVASALERQKAGKARLIEPQSQTLQELDS